MTVWPTQRCRIASSRHSQRASVFPDVTVDGRLRVSDASLQVEERWYAPGLARVTFLGRPGNAVRTITWAKGRDGRAVPCWMVEQSRATKYPVVPVIQVIHVESRDPEARLHKLIEVCLRLELFGSSLRTCSRLL